MRTSGWTTKGMTFVEVLITGTFGALLLLSLAAATGNVLDSYSVSLTEIELSRDLATCMDTISKAVRNASQATVPNANRISLTDANGDALAFGWSGTPGDPLVMRVAGTDDYDLVSSVQDFTVTLNNINRDNNTNVEAAEETFISFDHYTYEDWHVKEIGPDDWRGAEFVISTDEEVEEIILTQVGTRLGKTGSYSGNMQVVLTEARAYDHPIPIKPVIATLNVPNADIINADWGGEWWLYWMTIDLTDDFVVYPNRQYCMYFKGTSASNKACMIRVREWDGSGSGPDNGIRMHRTTDAGATWWPTQNESSMDLYDIPFELTGKMVTRTAQAQAYAHSIDITITMKRNQDTQTLKRREQLRGGSYRP